MKLYHINTIQQLAQLELRTQFRENIKDVSDTKCGIEHAYRAIARSTTRSVIVECKVCRLWFIELLEAPSDMVFKQDEVST